ncbi:MAG: N-acetylmuramoyl-L-alanine amidase [Bacteroidia bacterium]|nr:N-acetylmuramoyl-L-alanine amidase [Bacteroidia bacterium]
MNRRLPTFFLAAGWLPLLWMAAAPGSAAAQQHLEAQARAGDGVYTFLDRYQVRTPCNLAYFYKINQLKKGQGLVAGRTYQLPVYVYAYNGQSIRSTLGSNDLPWAEKIQRYNEVMLAWQLKPADYRTDKQLWVPYHQLYCRAEDLELREPGPALAQTPAVQAAQRTPAGTSSASRPARGTYPIFGPKYARVPLEGTDLNGCVYYLVAGHGGPDPGAVGRFGTQSLCEDEYAYDITLRLARVLLSYGATVYIIVRDPDDGIREGEILPCDKDEVSWVEEEIPVSQADRLGRRSEVINELYRKNAAQGVRYQRLVEIHIDSGSQSEQIDMFFYYQPGVGASQEFAQRIHATIREKYDTYRKGRGYTGTVSQRDLFMLRECEPTAVFIELGNISNRNDQARLVIEGNRDLIANWLFEGLLQDVKK